MPATDSELTSMESKDSHALKDEEGSLTDVPSSVPPTTIPPSTPLVPTTTKPNFTSETVIETKAISVASNDCSLALSSPAEASPARPAVTSPTGTAETSPATSHIASASDSLNLTGTPPPLLPATTFGNPDPETDFPAVLTFKGVSVTLENNGVWKQFNSRGTEMILTKQGRRMFPYCRYRVTGLEPDRQYNLVLSIVPSDCYRYRWNVSKWEVSGLADQQAQAVIRAFSHHPCLGSEWMNGLVSFYKLKLTNNVRDQRGHIILHSMHRYIPRLHIIPVLDGNPVTPDKPVFMETESFAFTFPQTEFMAVTTYQNFRITQLKINHNPFAKGFREDGNNSRLNRIMPLALPVVQTDTQPSALEPELAQVKDEDVDSSTKNHTVSASLSNNQKTRLVLKPIMSTIASKDEPYVPCIRGNHALGELVLVQKHPGVEPKEELHSVSVTPNAQQGLRATPIAKSTIPASTVSTLGSSSGYRKKRRRRINRRWANSRGREWKAATASPTVVHSPSLTVAMQPELDDVEGLLFVSFSSKEALEVHVRDKQTNSSSSAAPVRTPMHLKQTVGMTSETDEEKMARLETVLLQDLHVLKHRQVIHPVLQEVGMKLSSLDPTKSIDLQYLGVHLPLPPPKQPEQGNSAPPGDDGLPFISRTGKTSDMTKIKGWKNKFIKSKEPRTPSNFDGSQKNLSAFCSNMLDEYLESEAQYISERAAAFSTNPEASVAYQLPAKGSSYVKTLESVLKHQNAASKFPARANKPCPLSHKPHANSAPTSSASPMASPLTPVQTGTRLPGTATANAASGSSSIFHRLSAYLSGVSQKSAVGFGQSHGMSHRTSGLTKFQLKLLKMETGALNEGLNRTQLTPDRLQVALSAVLTKEMQSSQILKGLQCPQNKPNEPECGQDFCRLGCVCSSLQQVNRGPFHCRRPECMTGCSCFKRKITKHLSAEESEQLIQPVYSVTSVEHLVQPRPDTHTCRLWNRNISDVDPEPLFAPKSAPLRLAPMKAMKRSSISCPPQPIREEDKDPVYKYLESMMTCARVREFNSKPPPEVTIEPKILSTSAPNITEKAGKTAAADLPKNYYRNLLTVKTEKTSQGTTSDETDVRKQIEIQSACQWDKDCKKVLEALCQRMNQNRLSQRFYVGPYCIHPVAKIFIRKPSGSLLTYRVRISKPSQTSDDEDEFDDGDEDWNMEAEEEGSQIEDPVMLVGVTPFLSGVLPAGKLRARTKPVGFQAHGLIQVNGKSYNQARLLLGNMGSLHPANRLAAYVTGRLHTFADISHKTSQKSDPTSQINTSGTLHIKAAGTVVPPIITARKTTELKTPTQPTAVLSQADTCRKGSIALLQNSQTSSTVNPVHTLVLGQRNSVNPFQSSMSSPVSLTVSPSLKTPSFLGQSGTYSFRICPPANQGTKDQNLPGVILPGGFTLIQLPTHGADGVADQSESAYSTNKADVDKALPPPLSTFARSKNLLSSRSIGSVSFSGMLCDEKIPSGGSGEAKITEVASNLDIGSEDLSSNSSDYCGEADEDEEDVDVETVEEVRQGLMISKMKEALRKALKESRDPSDNFGPPRDVQGQMDSEYDESKANRRRKNHTVLERQRRSELRNLFDKLQTILQSDPRAPRLRLLSLALKEIQNLVETSRCLEEKKRRLIQMQSLYVKELSLLSGKSDKVIKHKLKQICDRQKLREKTMKWTPFFSSLLQSRAAYLQTNPQSKLLPSSLSLLDRHTTPSSTSLPTAAPQLSGYQKILPIRHSMSVAVSSPAQVKVTAPLPQDQPPAAPAQVSTSSSECQVQVPPVTAMLKVTTGQDGASAMTSAPHSSNPSVRLQQSLAYPLIRSKTGRIILPSSLKQSGQVYTVMVMNTNKNGEDSENNMQPPEVCSSRTQSNNLLKSENSLESCHILDENETVKPVEEEKTSSNSEPSERSDVNPISMPLVAVQAAENSQEGGEVAGLRKKLPSPPVRRGRGRPRKTAVTSVSENRKPAVVEDSSKSASESETSILGEERQNEKMTSELAKDTSEMVNDHPIPVKRGRGRPPKKTSIVMHRHSTIGTGSSPSKSDEDNLVRLVCKSSGTKSSPTTTSLVGDRNTSRPLTRGALGKDFPSAKKRSWKDIEKDLEPELQSE